MDLYCLKLVDEVDATSTGEDSMAKDSYHQSDRRINQSNPINKQKERYRLPLEGPGQRRNLKFRARLMEGYFDAFATNRPRKDQ